MKQIRKELSNAGWTVFPCHGIPGLDLYLGRGGDQALLGVAYLDLTEVLLQRVQEFAVLEKRAAVLVVDNLPQTHVLTSAEERSVLVIHHSDLASLSEHLLSLQRRVRDRYGAVKSRLLKHDEEVQEKNGRIDAAHSGSTIYRSDYIQADLFDGGGGELVVTFGDCEDRPTQAGLVDAAFRAREGLSELCIRTLSPNFFPAHDLSRFIADLNTTLLARFKRRWAWGILQGGYGALKYGRALGCTDALVVSPVYSIDPWDVSDGRVNQYFDQSLHFEMTIKAAERADELVVLYDPYDDNDDRQFKLISGSKGVRSVRLPFSADATRWLFKSAPFTEELLAAYRERDWAAMGRMAVAAKKRLPNREFRVAYALATRRPATSMKIFRKLGRDRVREWTSVCFLLAKAGYIDELFPLLEEAAERFPEDVSVNICAALMALDKGLPEETLRYVKVGLQADGMNVSYNWIKQSAEKMAE